jgi:hypothetical protein
VRRSACFGGTLLAALVLAACDNTNATAPTSVPTTQGEITIRSIELGSGATLSVRQCEWYTWYVEMCADRSLMTFDVLYPEGVSEAVLTASFYNGSQRCGIAYSPLPGPPLRAGGSAFPMTVSAISLSDEDHRLLCPLPATTTRVVVQLWERNRTAAPLLAKEFAHTYTFVEP